ncbi:MAG: hypothetical protein IPO00_08860 [Betaproteobacteria bacterium]|nr:hypothetical protein [Betaproteobacteria bacterium]
MTQFLLFLFGASWKTSLIGLASGLILAIVTYAQARPEPGWYVVAIALTALGRLVKDSGVTGGTVPATPEAAKRAVG